MNGSTSRRHMAAYSHLNYPIQNTSILLTNFPPSSISPSYASAPRSRDLFKPPAHWMEIRKAGTGFGRPTTIWPAAGYSTVQRLLRLSVSGLPTLVVGHTARRQCCIPQHPQPGSTFSRFTNPDQSTDKPQRHKDCSYTAAFDLDLVG